MFALTSRLLLLLLFPALSESEELRVQVLCGGAPSVAVEPGRRLGYEVLCELDPGAGGGLASFRFDLHFEGGALAPALAPEAPPMTHFAFPLGINNPAGAPGTALGFGGTATGGALLQVGGAQNTLGVHQAAAPRGALLPDVARHGFPQVLVRGELEAPLEPGGYLLRLSGFEANVLVSSDQGAAPGTVAAARAGSIENLRIVVLAAGETPPAPALDVGRAAPAEQSVPLRFQPRMGEPLPGLDPEELARFETGRARFEAKVLESQGLGPLFNLRSCVECHGQPATGGSSPVMVKLFGKSGPVFDPLLDQGGPLFQASAIAAPCEEFLPQEADVLSRRISLQLCGNGLVERLSDETLLATAKRQLPERRGLAHMVQPLEGGPARVGRFGWKSQMATLLSFSADAALNEIGQTNRLRPEENLPNGNARKLSACDKVGDPEDKPDAEGFDRITRVTHFQQWLAPPPQTPRRGMRGEAVFRTIGCADCHQPSFRTPPSSEPVFSQVQIQPFSDFLLHDMDVLGDGIGQGQALPSMMRTAPLWGLVHRRLLLHDGRASDENFANRAESAITQHAGEGLPAREAYSALALKDQQALLGFLASLGRAEFDAMLDNRIDAADWEALAPLFTGPGSFFDPDAPAALADVDADGDFDLADYQVFMRARGSLP